MRKTCCGLLLALAACDAGPTTEESGAPATTSPIQRIFKPTSAQIPANMADLCLFPTTRSKEHIDASGNTTRTPEGTVCLAGDSVAASLERYRDNPNVVEFEIEPSGSGLVVHSLVRHPVSENLFKVDFDIYPDPNPRDKAVARFGSLYIDGNRTNSLSDIDAVANLIRRPEFTGVIIEASPEAPSSSEDYTEEGIGEVEAFSTGNMTTNAM